MQHIRPNMSKSGKRRISLLLDRTLFLSISGLSSGLTISERQKTSKILNCQRSMPAVARKINSHNRLVGGADEESVIEETLVKDPLPESVQEVSDAPSLSPPIPSTSPSSPAEKSLDDSAQLEENSQTKQLLPASGPCCVCIPQTPGSVG